MSGPLFPTKVHGNVTSLTRTVENIKTRFRHHIEALQYANRVLYFTRTPAESWPPLHGLVIAEIPDRKVTLVAASSEWRHSDELLGAGGFIKREHDLHGIRLAALIVESELIARMSLAREESLQPTHLSSTSRPLPWTSRETLEAARA